MKEAKCKTRKYLITCYMLFRKFFIFVVKILSKIFFLPLKAYYLSVCSITRDYDIENSPLNDQQLVF